MIFLSPKIQKEYDDLHEELKQIGEFRRGSINVVFRKCGKSNCVCSEQNHPGHGPQTTLTFKDQGKSKIRNLSSRAEIALVRRQVENHDRFIQWSKKWLALNEKICNQKVVLLLAEDNSEQMPQEKKLRGTSGKKSKKRSIS